MQNYMCYPAPLVMFHHHHQRSSLLVLNLIKYANCGDYIISSVCVCVCAWESSSSSSTSRNVWRLPPQLQIIAGICCCVFPRFFLLLSIASTKIVRNISGLFPTAAVFISPNFPFVIPTLCHTLLFSSFYSKLIWGYRITSHKENNDAVYFLRCARLNRAD